MDSTTITPDIRPGDCMKEGNAFKTKKIRGGAAMPFDIENWINTFRQKIVENDCFINISLIAGMKNIIS